MITLRVAWRKAEFMDKIESFIYNLVRNNPIVKNTIRNLYQSFFDLLPRKKEYFKYHFDFKEGYYFGFHDIQELSEDCSKLLVQRLSFDLRMPLAGETAQVGYLDFSTEGQLGEFHAIGNTSAWNYHKGCRLQWLDNQRVIFNSTDGGKLISRMVDVETGKSSVIGYPIDTVSHDSVYATSFSYDRLEHCMSGYGYPYSDDSFLDLDSPKETGLFLVDLKTGDRDLFLSLADLSNSVPEEFRKGYMHYVTHSEFSLDDRYISFLHRWKRRTGTDLKRWTRIMVYDRTNGILTELPTQLSGSHCVWISNDRLIASCIIDGRSSHVLFDMNDIASYRIIAPSVLNSDGHQSYIDEDSFITDTYPDKYRMAHLIKAVISSGKTELLASIYSPKLFQSNSKKGHIACDLHPRVSPDGRFVFFDCCRTGKRGIYVMRLS